MYVPILGMHRSGTSCLAGICEHAGLFFLDPSRANRFNVKGNRENLELVNLNDDLLGKRNMDWTATNPIEPSSPSAAETHAIREFLDKNIGNAASNVIGFKDPRMTITYDFWRPELNNHWRSTTDAISQNFLPVATYRNPLAVAKSLFARDKMDQKTAIAIWTNYNSKLLEICLETQCPLVYFSHVPSLYTAEVGLALNAIGEHFNLRLAKKRAISFFQLT